MNFLVLTGLLAAVLTLGDHAFIGRTRSQGSPPPDNSLVFHYKFNEGTGTNLTDEAGAYDGWAVGGTWVTGASGSGGALQFNGTSDWARTASQVVWGTNAVSISLWLYWDAYANNDDLAFELGPNTAVNYPGFFLDPNSSFTTPNFCFSIRDAGGYSTRSISRPSAAVWHHYVLTYNHSSAPSVLELYVDGVLQSLTSNANATSQTTAFVTHYIYLMCRGGTTTFGAGRLDDFRAYKGVLDATEVAYLFANPQ